MSTLENWTNRAVEKLKNESAAVNGQKEKIMAPAVGEALTNFCLQDEEFAQAVVQGGSFHDCMVQVAKGVGNAISDLDAYKKAVQFFFPSAKIRMQMAIDLHGKSDCAEATPEVPAAEEKPTVRMINLDLSSFF